MDLETEIRAVMSDAEKSLTVEEVTDRILPKLQNEVRSALNTLVRAGELNAVHGGGTFKTMYRKEPKGPNEPIKRRI